MRRFIWMAAGLAGYASFPGSAFAGTCALCREALSSGGSPGLIRGFYFSILLLAGMPLLIFAAAAVLAWRVPRGKQPVVERKEAA